MSVLAHFEPVDKATTDQRYAPRVRLSLGSVIEPCQSPVVIQNISTTGLLFEAAAELTTGSSFEVQLPGMNGLLVANVIWREGELFGCQFEKGVPKAVVSAAMLRSIPLIHLEDQSSSDRAKFAAAPRDATFGDRETDAYPIRTVSVAALISALISAGLIYLMITASATTLIVLGGSLLLLCVLLVACCSWALDNTPHI